MPFFYAFNWKIELRQLCIKTSWSTLIQKLFLRGPAVVISWTPWFWSNPSDIQMKFRSECCFFVVSYPRQQKSVRKQKNTWKKCRSNWSLVRLVCARIGLWSDMCALETASDQTVPEQSGLWSGKFQTIVQKKVRSKPFPDHVIRAHREHVCARNSSDQGSLRSGHLDLGKFVFNLRVSGTAATARTQALTLEQLGQRNLGATRTAATASIWRSDSTLVIKFLDILCLQTNFGVLPSRLQKIC